MSQKPEILKGKRDEFWTRIDCANLVQEKEAVLSLLSIIEDSTILINWDTLKIRTTK